MLALGTLAERSSFLIFQSDPEAPLSMSIFTLHSNVLADYRDYVRSFFTVADDRAREFIGRELDEQARLDL